MFGHFDLFPVKFCSQFLELKITFSFPPNLLVLLFNNQYILIYWGSIKMGAFCCCPCDGELEEYTLPSNSIYRHCLCLRYFFHQLFTGVCNEPLNSSKLCLFISYICIENVIDVLIELILILSIWFCCCWNLHKLGHLWSIVLNHQFKTLLPGHLGKT